MFYWKLNDYEIKLAEEVFKQREVIYVDHNGVIFAENGLNPDGSEYERVDSNWYAHCKSFKAEIETAKIIVDLRKTNGAKNYV